MASGTTAVSDRETLLRKDSSRIRGLFADISPRYDFLNHFLSLNVDRSWRRALVRGLDLSEGDHVLDVCTGTGDLALEFARRLGQLGGGRVVGTDFTHEMLTIGRRKISEQAPPRTSQGADSPEAAQQATIRLALADTLRLPFADERFDAVSVAFGIRNVVDLDAGLREMLRVLRPGGKVAILEFSRPRSRWFRRVFELYFHRVLPRLGGWLSGSRKAREAYSYLPASVSEFLSPAELAARLEAAGFANVQFRTLSLGIAALHFAQRPRS